MANSEIRAILFDKDGTLIDFFASWTPAYMAAAEGVAHDVGTPGLSDRLLLAGGYDPKTHTIEPTSVLACGNNAEIAELWTREPELAHLDPADLSRRITNIFNGIIMGNPKPVTDLQRLFEKLKGRGLGIGVATSDSTEGAKLTLSHFGVLEMMDYVAGFDAGFGAKPGPGMVHGFCDRLGVDAGAVAVVGDSLHDLDMARAAGAGLAIGVLTGVSDRATLDPHADHVLDSIAQLESVL